VGYFYPLTDGKIKRGELMIEIVIFLIGVLLGSVLCYFYLRERLAVQLERWKFEVEEKIRSEVLERSRSVLKGKIGEQLAPLLPVFKYEPADARFMGTPVDYVVFDGLAKQEPKEVIFMDVKTGKTGGLSPIQKKIKQVIEQKRVRWETVQLRPEE